MDGGLKKALDYTHVLYDQGSLVSKALALVTLSPILLMASYAALCVQTRELLIVVMWAGQLFGEIFNALLKHLIKAERPQQHLGNGYGFPSSHSQYMGYFSSFLICHLYFRHRFMSTGVAALDTALRMTVYFVLLAWAALVAYSRYYLGYHDALQVVGGLVIGIGLGVAFYVLSQEVPRRRPHSFPGRVRAWMLDGRVGVWLRLRDGWAVWTDGGREDEWRRWRREWRKGKE